MLKAAKNRWFESLFAVYNTNLLRRRFHSFRFRGLDNLTNPRSGLPLIIFANHSSWWDGLAAFQISRAGGLDSYVMMEERHLRRYFLFRGLGAFSIVREDPRAAYRSLEYASGLLREDGGRSLWMFPQGKIVPAGRRPLGFYPGIAKLLEMTGPCRVVPVVFRYEFEGDFKPSVYGLAGSPRESKTGEIPVLEDLERSMESCLNEQDRDIREKVYEGYEELI